VEKILKPLPSNHIAHEPPGVRLSQDLQFAHVQHPFGDTSTTPKHVELQLEKQVCNCDWLRQLIAIRPKSDALINWTGPFDMFHHSPAMRLRQNQVFGTQPTVNNNPIFAERKWIVDKFWYPAHNFEVDPELLAERPDG
jgi:hypothetical protein